MIAAVQAREKKGKRNKTMSIFDTLMGAVEKHPELNQEQHSTLLQTAMQMFGNHAGLSGLMNNAESQGIGNIFQSWVSTGANQSIAPQQVQGLVGQDKINELAQRVGVPPAIASAALARILPIVVDKLTPSGKLPQAA
ncbi:MAG: hypothetical protein DMG61_22825 [Acidobacteria bacterium]|nr:MAG: hypothetical protein DMG61_22825 [Acidobacteriota bacterium]PYY20359.1 MAG: hypothetical protein DMG60_00215 [Acidobacteriota bacterium]